MTELGQQRRSARRLLALSRLFGIESRPVSLGAVMLVTHSKHEEQTHGMFQQICFNLCKARALVQRQIDRSETSAEDQTCLGEWLAGVGLDPTLYGAHSHRCTKATLIYKKTGNLRAVQLLLGHTKIESTVGYLGIEVGDALEMTEQIDI